MCFAWYCLHNRDPWFTSISYSTGFFFLSSVLSPISSSSATNKYTVTVLSHPEISSGPITMRRFSTKVLYVGLGTMGFPIAGVLSKAFPTAVWNRTQSKTEAHAKQFGTTPLLGPSPWDHDLSDVDVMLTCLPTSNEVQTLSQDLLSKQTRVKPGLVWLDNTSGYPALSKQIGASLLPREVYFLDTPISGGRKGAANSALTIATSGNKQAYERALPVLQKMGKNISYLGEKVGTAHAWKGLNNLLYGCNLLLAMKAGQAFEKQGIDVNTALKAVMTSSGGSNSMVRVHEYMTHNRTIDYSFLASFLIKDMNIGLSLIDKHDENDPTYRMFTIIRDLYVESAKEKGYNTSEVFDAFGFIEK